MNIRANNKNLKHVFRLRGIMMQPNRLYQEIRIAVGEKHDTDAGVHWAINLTKTSIEQLQEAIQNSKNVESTVFEWLGVRPQTKKKPVTK